MDDIAAVRIDGLNELRAALRQAPDGSAKEVTVQLKVGARKVTARAVELAPERTGALKRNLKAFATQRSGGVKATLPYAPVQEFSRKYKGTPPRFAYRAINELGPGLADDAFTALVGILTLHGWFSG